MKEFNHSAKGLDAFGVEEESFHKALLYFVDFSTKHEYKSELVEEMEKKLALGNKELNRIICLMANEFVVSKIEALIKIVALKSSLLPSDDMSHNLRVVKTEYEKELHDKNLIGEDFYINKMTDKIIDFLIANL